MLLLVRAVKKMFVVERFGSGAYSRSLPLGPVFSLQSELALPLGMYVCVNASLTRSEPGRTQGESVLIDFKVVTDGNASHG